MCVGPKSEMTGVLNGCAKCLGPESVVMRHFAFLTIVFESPKLMGTFAFESAMMRGEFARWAMWDAIFFSLGPQRMSTASSVSWMIFCASFANDR